MSHLPPDEAMRKPGTKLGEDGQEIIRVRVNVACLL